MTPQGVAKEIKQPLFKVRSAMREFVAAHLLEQSGDTFQATPAGLAKLSGGQ